MRAIRDLVELSVLAAFALVVIRWSDIGSAVVLARRLGGF